MSLLRNRNYLLLRTAWSISSFGTKVQSFAFSLYVLAITGSAVQFSITLCMQMLPIVLFAPFSGFAADRLNRKVQIVLYDILSALTVTVLLFLYLLNGKLSVLLIYACVFVLSGIDAFFNSTACCLMQASVDPSDYIRQRTVDTTISSMIALFVPAVAGIIYSFTGLAAVLIINALSFLVSAVLESMIRLPKYRPEASSSTVSSFFSSIREGFHYIKTSPFIISFLLIVSLLNFILPGVDIGLMTISNQLMRLSPAIIGFENSAISVGTLAGALICGFLNKKLENAKLSRIISADLLATTAVFFGVSLWLKIFYGALPLSLNVVLFVLLNIIIVIANEFLSINLSAQFQRQVPNELMGRTGSFVSAALVVSTPLGQVTAGLLFGGLPFFAAYLIDGVLSAGLLLYCVFSGKSSGKAVENVI